MKKVIAAALIGCLSFGSGLTAAVGAEAASASFADLNGHWSKPEVEYLVGKGIIDGVDLDGKRWILPDKTLTRAEFVKILVGALNQKKVGSNSPSFKDVPSTHWAFSYIETAKKEGWIDGFENGSFQPDAPISRSELATLLVRGYHLKEQPGTSIRFADVLEDYWAYSSIRTAASNKLIEGTLVNGSLLYKPAAAATRAESIVVMARYLKSQEEGNRTPVTPANPEDSNTPETTDITGNSESGTSNSSSSSSSRYRTVNLEGQELINAIGKGKPVSGDDGNGNSLELSSLSLVGFNGDVNAISISTLQQDSIVKNSSNTVVPGLTGPVIEFNTNGYTFSNATLTFNVSSMAAKENLVAAYYNETTHKFEFLNSNYNTADKTLSFSTNHNSKYVLIDKTAWDQAWRNSLSVTSGVYKPYVDFAFIIDSSGSMTWTDPKDLRKKAVTDLVYGLNANKESEQVTEKRDVTVGKNVYHFEGTVYKESDRAAIIDFDSSARSLVTFSAYGQTVASAVYYIDSNGSTNIFAGLKLAYEMFDKDGDENHRFIAVLLTDGQDNSGIAPDWNAIQTAYGKGVTLVTMGLSNEVDKAYLEKMALLGGGQYFEVLTSDQLETAFNTVVGTTRHDKEMDVDHDGIDDYYEVTGMLLENGMLVKTSIDPVSGTDTDGDGYSDGEEMGEPVDVIITADMMPPGSDLVGKTVKMFKNMKSMPTDPTDIPKR